MNIIRHGKREKMVDEYRLASYDEPILVTGAGGYIGARVVHALLVQGYRRVRCLVRTTGNLTRLHEAIASSGRGETAELVYGNLLDRDDCSKLSRGVVIIYHLAAGTGTKAFSDAFLHSVVATRNLLDAALENGYLRRFVNISSFAVYTNRGKSRFRVLDETAPVELNPESRSEAYCYGKVKQDELVVEYGRSRALPFVILRPGTVYGPGKDFIPGRVGIDPFGIYLHFGGSNPLPLTYVDNCADAIVLAGLKNGINQEVFNVVDDDLPSSRRFLRLYKKHVRNLKSIYIPHALSYLFCFFWEKYSTWSKGQLPPVYTRREWAATWKKTRYDNSKLKKLVGWEPKTPTVEGLRLFFDSARASSSH
jgi:nucleoside-diphosphate-sugar epimerase